jgi:hypothetical protein
MRLHGVRQPQCPLPLCSMVDPRICCPASHQDTAANGDQLHGLNGAHPGLQQRGGEVVGATAGQLALEVPAKHAAAAHIPRARHDVCPRLRLLPGFMWNACSWRYLIGLRLCTNPQHG